MSRGHAHVFCSACRSVILVPLNRDGTDLAMQPPTPWVHDDPHHYCTAECQAKGPAEPVRERAQAVHIRMAHDLNPDHRRGFNDALLGYDCVGIRPHYIKGHAEGMAVREVIDAAVAELGKNRGPK